MRFYVAGRTSDIDTVRAVQAILTDNKHIITYDWTQAVEEFQRKETPDIAGKVYASRCARADLRGVRSADVLIMVIRSEAKGTWVELGVALALGIPVWAFVMEELGKCVFLQHPLVAMHKAKSYGDLLETIKIKLGYTAEEHTKSMPYADRTIQHTPS